jgi:hypothetical protein
MGFATIGGTSNLQPAAILRHRTGAAAVGSCSARSSRSGGMRWRAGRRSYEQRHVAEMAGRRWPRCEAPQSDSGAVRCGPAVVGGQR